MVVYTMHYAKDAFGLFIARKNLCNVVKFFNYRLGGSDCIKRQMFRSFHTSSHTATSLEKVKNSFKSLEINRIFILEKVTKYDLELRGGLTADEIRHRFPLAYKTHNIHKRIMESLLRQLRGKYRIHSNVVKAQSPGLSMIDCENSAFPPDMIISAGGDGTFLEAASLVPPMQVSGKPLWVVGINTDPERSLGALCISYFERESICSKKSFPNYDGLCSSDSPSVGSESDSLYYRRIYESPKQNRIRFIDSEECSKKGSNSSHAGMKEILDISSASFEKNGKVIPLGNEGDLSCSNPYMGQLASNLYHISYDDYVKHLLEKLLVHRTFQPICRQRIRLKLFKRGDNSLSSLCNKRADSTTIETILFSETDSSFDSDDLRTERSSMESYSIPYGAVNDTMIADKCFGRTFYALVQVDDSPIMRVKSSGVLITTGTGSTAWAYNICKINISDGYSLIKCLLDHPAVPKELSEKIDCNIISEAIECHNRKLVFDPSRNVMKCIIREGINESETVKTSSYTGKQVKLLALTKDAMLFIDGSKALSLDYGDVVVLKTFDADTVWSLI